jgi:hypothetical protein
VARKLTALGCRRTREHELALDFVIGTKYS